MSEPSPYRRIKQSIEVGIGTGQWGVGDLLPSEHDLCRLFGVSRMTVNRAMRELSHERLIRRVAGVGSFVAEPQARSGLVEIRNIADEISERGHVHRADVRLLMELEDPDMRFGTATMFHSIIVHFEGAQPLQVEDRLVSPDLAPGYLDQDFTDITPNAFLMRTAPLGVVQHVVQASPATEAMAAMLAIEPGDACLVVTRRTWSAARLASIATLYHAGARFRLAGNFKV